MINLPNFYKLCSSVSNSKGLGLYPNHTTLLSFVVSSMKLINQQDVLAMDYLLLVDDEIRQIALNKYFKYICPQVLKELYK